MKQEGVHVKKLQTIVIFMIIWVILNENIRPFTLISGIVISIFTLQFTNRLLKMDYSEEFYVPPVAAIVYLFQIIKEIYLAGFDMVKRIFTGNVHPTFIEYESQLSDQMALVLLANSITLTPGTVTVDRYQNHMTILSANPDVEDVRAGTYEGLEKKLDKFEGRNKCS